ncbi:MAG: HTH domain-containing protein [Polyangiales bacterium]
MTFTEAAVEILRLVGKPLHYKKITEIAIERNLLSHVGKTPEVTMSSRLATMVRKDRGDAPILKVKPGIFALREFSAEALEDTGSDVEVPKAEEKEEEAKEFKAPETSNHPGADVFPEEDDDDVPILASLEQNAKAKREQKDEEGGDSRRSKRSRLRRGRRDEEEKSEERSERSERGGRDRDRSRRGSRRSSKKKHLDGDWDRQTGAGESAGRDLADSVEGVIGRRSRSFVSLAEALIEKGRLSGDASALAPTLAAALRGDGARRAQRGAPPRFLIEGTEVTLVSQRLPADAGRAEAEAFKHAQRQQEIVRRVFLKRIGDLPSSSLLELLATWLNAMGVVGVRGVRRPTSSGNEFHLAGTLRTGPLEIPLAIVILRDGELTREIVIDARGALHHYGDARAVWVIGLGPSLSGAREEAGVSGAAPVALFDGPALSESMEDMGIGLRRWSVPLTTMDFDLLDGLRGPGNDQSKSDDKSDKADKSEKSEKNEDSEEEGEEKKGRRRRRRRRKGTDETENAEATENSAASSEADAETVEVDTDSAAESETDSEAETGEAPSTDGGAEEGESTENEAPSDEDGSDEEDVTAAAAADEAEEQERSGDDESE